MNHRFIYRNRVSFYQKSKNKTITKIDFLNHSRSLARKLVITKQFIFLDIFYLIIMFFISIEQNINIKTFFL